MKFVIATMVFSFVLMGIGVCQDANAQCLEDSGEEITLASSEAEPVEFIVNDLCYGWDAPTGTVDHYHFYVNGVIQGKPAQRVYQYTMPVKNTVYEISVEGVSAILGVSVGPMSNPYFVRWVDRDISMVCLQEAPAQCLADNSNRVVGCP